VQEKLTSFHNQIFKKLIDSGLFNKFNDHYFLPPVGTGRYSKAQGLISELNKEYTIPVIGTAYTKANSKEYVFVNVKNLLPRAQDEAKGPQLDLAEIQAILNQKQSLVSSKASPKTIGKVKEWLSRIGVDIKTLDSKRYGGVNGIANLLKATIEIAEGKESTALPEEAMHFAVDILKTSNPGLYRAMFNKIGQFNIYQQTRDLYANSPEYKNPDGSLNVPKIKEEAIGKLLAEYYIKKEEFGTEKPELLLQTKTWWDQLVEWIKSLLGVANFNPFEEAVNTLPENNKASDGHIKELAELIQAQDVPSYMRDSIDQAFDRGEYREIVSTIADQLADTPTYETTKRLYLGGDEALAQEILSVYQQMLQIQGEEPVKNEFADDLMKKLDAKIEEFDLKKVENPKANEEDDNNYYEATIGGVRGRTDRTTEYAKRANVKYTGGKDFLANLTPEEKAYNDKFAWNGLNVHFDIERIIQSARNEDGTIKPKGTFVPNIVPTGPKAVFKVLQNFLLGTDQTTGFLYQFEPGTKVVIEQPILNEKAKTKTEDGKVLIGRAGTIDLLVLEPASEKHPKGLATIYDWKVMNMSENSPEYKFPKQSQHKIQITDYKRTLKEGYGLKESEIQAFAIPIAGKYTIDEDRKTGVKTPKLESVKIGNVDIKTEDRPWLLPVVPDDQSTGNTKIDSLVRALRAKYDRIYKKPVPANQQAEKEEDLNEMSSAIRNLQVAINFEPLSVEALTFQHNVGKIIDKYSSYDAKGKTPEEYNPILSEIASNINAASYYSDIDRVFSSEYKDTPNLSEKNKAILDSLQKTSSAAKDSVDKLQAINSRIVAQIAAEGGIKDILSPEKEAKGITNSWLQAGTTPIKSKQFLTQLAVDARSADVIKIMKIEKEFGDLYTPLEKLASSKGKSPYEMIADVKEHKLKRRLSRDVLDIIKKAKNDRNKKAILDNIDIDTYNKLAADRIKERLERLDLKTFSNDEVKNAKLRKQAKASLIRTLDINDENFDGWKNKTVAQFIRQSIKEEENYSDFYKELHSPELKPALDMYNFILELNEWAKSLGYIESKHTEGFLAYVNATLLQRVNASEDKFKTFKEALGDKFTTVQPDEGQMYGRKDAETGELTRSIPRLYTSERDEDKRSTDLLSIISLYIKSLVRFETSQKLDPLFAATLLMEKNKGHLETQPGSGKVIFQGDTPQVFPGNSVNANRLQSYIDTQIYDINLQASDLIDTIASKIDSREGKEERALSAKKILQSANRLTQQLAVGLKPLIATANAFGAAVQAEINNSGRRYYTPNEYKTNELKEIGSLFTGVKGNIRKGLTDLIIPLGEEALKKHYRGVAWKQSSLKWLSTLSMQDVMMSSNRLPDDVHMLVNADCWMENTMVVDGKLENIRQYLRNQPEFTNRYKVAEQGGRSVAEVEKEFEAKVKELKKTKSLPEIAKFNSEGYLEIPGFDIHNSNLAEYRAKVVEYGRKITSQVSRENAQEANTNIIAKSFAMFKNWIIPQVEQRALDIHKDPTLDDWEYGRVRLFAKVVAKLGFKSIAKIRDITKATPEGIRIMREMYESKIEQYYRKTGQKLDITEQEFFDLVRKELRSEGKELALLIGIVGIVFTIKSAVPPDDENDPTKKNRLKYLAKALTKMSNEIDFYYNPLSAESITRGTILPSFGLLTKAERLLDQSVKEMLGGPETQKGAHPLKALFSLIPGPSQFQTEILPLWFPEEAKELGIRPTAEARILQ
jgi:hypothetical protein